MKGALVVASLFEDEVPLSRANQRRIWTMFMDGGTSHSSRAATLAYIMRRCEREGVRYTLSAIPGIGYHICPTVDHVPGKDLVD